MTLELSKAKSLIWYSVFTSVLLMCLFFFGVARIHAAIGSCIEKAGAACYLVFQPNGAKGDLHYYSSMDPRNTHGATLPTNALIAIHGHPRDAGKTFDAALLAAQHAGRVNDTVVVAPVFQVPAAAASKCDSKGLPGAEPGDLLWTCQSWLEGELAINDNHTSSFDALDGLVAELKKQWPSLETVTMAGFSAGAQMVQHYIAFASDQPALALRYVVSDPGSWLYFDRYRAQPQGQSQDGGRAADWSACASSVGGNCTFTMVEAPANCANANSWKYGVENLPKHLKINSEQARVHYAKAEIHYLEGGLDSGTGHGAFYPILDKSCAANAQGPYRLQRGLAYAAYDRVLLSPEMNRTVIVVPGCAHDVACVFPSPEAQVALFGRKSQ